MFNGIVLRRCFGMFDFCTPIYFIRDIQLIKTITIKSFEHFEDRSTYLDEKIDQLFGNSMFFMSGRKWRNMRSTLSPAFTGTKMRQMLELVSECAQDLKTHLLNESEDGAPVNWEMKELFARYANDVIATTAFGIKVDSLKNVENDFYQIGRQSLEFSGVKAIMKFLMLRTMPGLMRRLNIQIADAKVVKFFVSMVTTTMNVRQEEKIVRPDMIDLLMKHRQNIASDDRSEHQWSEKELIAQCFLFYLAGFESVSTQLSFLMHELLMNKKVQDRLYEEVATTDKMLNGQQIDFEILKTLKYLDQVVAESLRKWPPTPTLERKCVKDFVYEDVDGYRLVIAEGSNILIPVYATHHNPDFFPDPEKFDPERFSEENRQHIIPNTYIPFGNGPRSCIGMPCVLYWTKPNDIDFVFHVISASRFAIMEIKVITYYIILNFSLVANEKTQTPLVLKKNPFILTAERGIHVQFKPRSASAAP